MQTLRMGFLTDLPGFRRKCCAGYESRMGACYYERWLFFSTFPVMRQR